MCEVHQGFFANGCIQCFIEKTNLAEKERQESRLRYDELKKQFEEEAKKSGWSEEEIYSRWMLFYKECLGLE